MNNQFSTSLAELSLAYVDPSQKSKAFQWLTPAPSFLDETKSKEIISELPDQLQTQLLSNQDLINFFRDDVRAFKLYTEMLPSNQILSDQDLDDHITIEEFNQFFKENYISTEAYKLPPKKLKEYQPTDPNGESQTWESYLSKQAQLQESSQSTQVKPNFSLKYFYTNLLPSSRIEFLNEKLNPQEQTFQTNSFSPSLQANLSELPELNTLSEQPSPQFSIIKQPASTQATTNYSIKANQPQSNLEVSKETISKDLNITQDIDVGFSQAQVPMVETLELQNQIAIENQSQLNNLSQSKETAQQSQQAGPQNIQDPSKNKIILQNALNQSQSPQNRQKGINYAKIIGYSSAGLLTTGSSALAIFNTLFG